MSDKPDDFERACAAYWEDSPLAGIEWRFASEATQARVRRGMLAALREIADQYHAELVSDENRWMAQAMQEGCAELIRQGEQQG